MSNFSDALSQWAKELQDIRLPRWEELPAFDLYLDQVLYYINEQLSFLNIGTTDAEKEEPLLTAAMVNNYVKQGYIPKPEKKRYKRIHLACLMIFVLLKTALPLHEIQQGLYLQVNSCKGRYGTAYNLFCRQFEKSLQYIAGVASGEMPTNDTFLLRMPLYLQGTYMATLSLTSKLFSQKVLYLNQETRRLPEKMSWTDEEECS